VIAKTMEKHYPSFVLHPDLIVRLCRGVWFVLEQERLVIDWTNQKKIYQSRDRVG